jgi:NACHT domain
MVTAGLFVVTAVLALNVAHHYRLGVAATSITVLFSGGGLGAFYLAWKSYVEAHRDTVGHDGLSDIADDLAKVVRKQAKTMAAGMGLDEPGPLSVSWRAADASLTDSLERLRSWASHGAGWIRPGAEGTRVDDPDGLAGSGSDLTALLGRVPAGRLVVLGGAGAGKTALMIKLVLDVLARRPDGGPVPVLISIADWNPKTDLLKWLKARMTCDYPALAAPAPGNAAKSRFGALLDAKLILPILDGLDEVPDALRRQAIVKINAAFTAGESFVVTCRTGSYRDAVRPPDGTRITLRGAVGIELRPLEAADVADYLREEAGGIPAENRWEPVVAALNAGGPLAEVLSTPLMVALASAIYNPRPGDHVGVVPHPADLRAFSRKEDIEHHLLEAIIRAAYRAPRGKHRPKWPGGKVEPWLTFLALHAKDTGNSTDLAWWKLSEALPRTLAGLAVGAVGFLTFGLAGWIAGGRLYGIGYGLAYGVAFGLAGGLSYGFRRCRPSRVQFRLRGASVTILRRCALGTAIGLLFALIIGEPTVTIGQPTVLAAGAVIGLMFGAAGLMTAPTLIDREPSPSATLRQDRSGTLATGLITGLALGIVGGLDVSAAISGSGSSTPGPAGVAAAVLICASAGAFLGRLEYGRIGTITYGIAGSVVGLLATAWLPPVSGVGSGLAFGLAFGFSAALAIMAPRAWGSFTISRVLLAARGRVPWRVMTFLDDARERGLLRQSGAVYQFRHALLCEHLGGQETAAPRSRGATRSRSARRRDPGSAANSRR